MSVRLQTNGVDAIFWQFLKPFLNITINGNPGTTSTSNSSTDTAPVIPDTNVSTGPLNNSNVLVASNSNVSANISQNFGGGGADPETTTAAACPEGETC